MSRRTTPGAFLNLVLEAVDADFAPQALMAVLKHPAMHVVDDLAPYYLRKVRMLPSALAGLPIGKWSGPILSGFGSHLIFIDAVKPASEPAFASIKEQLLNDYRYDYQQQFNQKVYDDFKKEYTIEMKITDTKLHQKLASNLIVKNVQ